MFKKVVTYPGFWRSVVSLGLAFVLLFLLIKWAIEGFSFVYLTDRDPLFFILGTLAAGFVYGFFVSFGKFRAKLKAKENRK
ncbi:MAG: hypothetical protein OQJ83_09725 [Altibacter sp.]|uniref:hypothetical protein n=1 Tax=Altibacter lentus TaxID=1223410 RepID=UPI00055241DE|nr:hypothetical protein [Altibacter lentus]MCW8981653.1 hypothetical protein [Altibacter sp.]